MSQINNTYIHTHTHTHTHTHHRLHKEDRKFAIKTFPNTTKTNFQ